MDSGSLSTTYLEPEYRILSHTHIISVCHRMYQEREKLEAELIERHVGLTSDIWTSAATQGDITVTAHFISDGWEHCSWVLLTREMGERHTGVNISERLLEAAKEWGITDEHVSGLVRDNAANDILGEDLTGWPHLGCVALMLVLPIPQLIRQYLQQGNWLVTLNTALWKQKHLRKSKCS